MDTVLVFVPSLAAILINAEKEAGRELSRDEVEEIRDNAACMAIPIEAAIKLEEGRGYSDFVPEQVWEDWLEYKKNGE